MYTFLGFLQVILSVVLIFLILLHSGKDAGLSGAFGVGGGGSSLGGGSMVHISSVSGQYGGPRTAHYAASKAGLISLAQVIARFGATHNIRSNTVAAGLIASDMAAAGMAASSVQKAAENILLRRMGTPR